MQPDSASGPRAPQQQSQHPFPYPSLHATLGDAARNGAGVPNASAARAVTAPAPTPRAAPRGPAPGSYPGADRGMSDPEILLINLSRCIFEVLAGARDLEQMARWVTDDVYRNLLSRDVLSKRARAVTKRPNIIPAFTIGNIRMSEPREGVVEAVVMVHSRARARVIAFRLEAVNNRWRASSFKVL